MSKREERIQTIATGLLISRMSPVDAITQAAVFVGLCEARDAAEAEAEATPEPEKDYRLELYVNAVRELGSYAEHWFIVNDYKHGFTPAQTIERWREHEAKLREPTFHPGEDHEFESYLSEVRELVPNADRMVIQFWHGRGVPVEDTAQRWLAFLAFTEQQRGGVNP